MSETRNLWRPEFIRALELFARLSDAMRRRGLPRPVLVGGGAAEYYSASALMTGDIDVASPVQPELEEEAQRLGFVRPSGVGRSLRGWVHPDLGLALEVVASSPMGGSAKVVLIDQFGRWGSFAIISVEDLIADRMGQYASRTAPEMLEQARQLLGLNPDVDVDYLDRRIRQETIGEYGVEDIEARR